VTCWGDDSYAPLGPVPADSTCTAGPCVATPTAVVQGTSVFGTNPNSTCVAVSGSVRCLGDARYGELGNGATTGANTCFGNPICTTTLVTIPTSNLNNVTAVASSKLATWCARMQDGSLKCWGAARAGQTGPLGGTMSLCNGIPCTPSPVAVTASGLTNVTSIALGVDHACATTSTGAVYCWGDNSTSQLGNLGVGATCTVPGWPFPCSPTPVQVIRLSSTVTALAAGGWSTCALLRDGTVWCWGSNAYGQLGNGSNTDSVDPVQVIGVVNARGVAAGINYACAAIQDGSIKCWGDNTYGQLGDGTFTSSTTPVQVHW